MLCRLSYLGGRHETSGASPGFGCTGSGSMMVPAGARRDDVAPGRDVRFAHPVIEVVGETAEPISPEAQGRGGLNASR